MLPLFKCFGDGDGHDDEDQWAKMPPATEEERREAIEEVRKLIRAEEAMLSVTGRRLGDAFVRTIASSMVGSATLRWLQLDRNLLGDASAEALGQVLRHPNTVLQSLDLDFNRIGDAGAAHIARALQGNSSLRDLQLQFNFIGHAGARSLAEALSFNETLRSISLHGNQVGEIGAECFARMLKDNTTLSTLSLYSNGIGDNGAKSLAAALLEGTSLRELALGANAIGPAGAQALARMLQKNRTLQDLHMDNNRIGDDGCKYFAQALKVNVGLKELWLVNNSITNDGIKFFGESLEENSTLERLGVTVDVKKAGAGPTEEDLLELRRSHAVRRVTRDIDRGEESVIADGKEFGQRGVRRMSKTISESRSLRQLSLKACNITDEDAYHLAEAVEKNKSLSQLSLVNNQIGDVGARRLATALALNTKVELLDLEGNPIGDDVATSISTPRISTPRSKMSTYFDNKEAVRTSDKEETPTTRAQSPVNMPQAEGHTSPGGGDWEGVDFDELAADIVDGAVSSGQASPAGAERLRTNANVSSAGGDRRTSSWRAVAASPVFAPQPRGLPSPVKDADDGSGVGDIGGDSASSSKASQPSSRINLGQRKAKESMASIGEADAAAPGGDDGAEDEEQRQWDEDGGYDGEDWPEDGIDGSAGAGQAAGGDYVVETV